MAQAMGIGEVGLPGVIFKRKFRWTLELNTPCGYIPPHFVKGAARPSLEIEETEINFLNAVSWIPGKAKWQPINVVYRDIPHKDMAVLYSWIATIYNFTDPVGLQMSEKRGWNGIGKLNLYDGCGTVLETWLLASVFPTSVNFGELDYESSEEVTIELTLRYSEVKYESFCGGQIAPCACVGC